MTHSATKRLTRDDLDNLLDVEYRAEPRQRATRHDPASGGEIEIVAITCGGEPFPITDAEEIDLIDWLAEQHEEE